MYWVYILKSIKSGTYYIGCTNNLVRRAEEHNTGLSKYTRNKGPWVFAYKQSFVTLREARNREKQIKSWKKRSAIEKLVDAAIV